MLFGLPPCAPISKFFFLTWLTPVSLQGTVNTHFSLTPKTGLGNLYPHLLLETHSPTTTELLPLHCNCLCSCLSPCYCHLLATFLLFHLFSASNCSIFCQMNDSKSSTSLRRFRRDDVKPMEAQLGKRTYLYSGSSEILPPPTVCTDSGHSRYFLHQQIATFFYQYVGSVQRQVYWLPGKYLPYALYTVGIK